MRLLPMFTCVKQFAVPISFIYFEFALDYCEYYCVGMRVISEEIGHKN